MFVPIGSNSGDDYQTQRSLRFRADASLDRAVSVAGNRRTWTLSLAAKFTVPATTQAIFSSYTNSASFLSLSRDSSGTLTVDGCFGGSRITRSTSTLFRDASAHTQIQLVCDTTQATDSDRLVLYVGGQRVALPTVVSGTWPTLNSLGSVGDSPATEAIGRRASDNDRFFDGYLSEVIFVDGQALTPASFGQSDSVSGQWVPKKYAGTYGTNGFYLDFSDPTSLTTLMLDRSGNGNNWTASNISLTAGATYDSMLDVPLGSGGQERGNYATFNPLDRAPLVTLSSSNLNLNGSGASWSGSRVGQGVESGKWYYEATVLTNSFAGNGVAVGIMREASVLTAANLSTFAQSTTWLYMNNNSAGGGYKGNNGTSTYGNSFTVGDVIGVAFDIDTGHITFYKNNVSQGVAFSSQIFGQVFPFVAVYGGDSVSINCGQRPFAYTLPSGFKALHTGNLTSDTVITSGSFTGNLNASGPFIWCNGTPETLTINGNAVTWGTHADKLANGFKIRTASSSYNSSGTNTWTATYLSPSSNSAFKYQNAKGNP